LAISQYIRWSVEATVSLTHIYLLHHHNTTQSFIFILYMYSKHPFLKVFCIWIWFSTALYIGNISSFSPLYLSIIAVSFAIPFNLFYVRNKIPFLYKVSIVLFELAIATLNTYKHFVIDKRPLVSQKDIAISILIFALYILFLSSINKTVYQVYFVDLLKR
jgi:hypothetical protein